MATWSILGETTLRHRPIIDGGGQARYGGLDLAAAYDPGARGLAVELLDPAPEARRWLLDILAGFREYEEERSSQGMPIGAVRLAVTRVYWHPVDTDPPLMRRLAKEAIGKLFERHGREVADP